MRSASSQAAHCRQCSLQTVRSERSAHCLPHTVSTVSTAHAACTTMINKSQHWPPLSRALAGTLLALYHHSITVNFTRLFATLPHPLPRTSLSSALACLAPSFGLFGSLSSLAAPEGPPLFGAHLGVFPPACWEEKGAKKGAQSKGAHSLASQRGCHFFPPASARDWPAHKQSQSHSLAAGCWLLATRKQRESIIAAPTNQEPTCSNTGPQHAPHRAPFPHQRPHLAKSDPIQSGL